ncbi:A disintegrin and metalloproteinase with thrombospondin motifs 9 isoform X2 [Tribolium castaneum]|uniref:A disintegrin and metalloproteinase with thrombospondin motifs 9 isoform X2 n=1 Tax=Tribolium castaneum TaxID=7070 RepID=UPI00046C2DC0|nr:PREDICTED: A disintegrin and metalloproteinase with thrombospondin motifs 9 isoform X2 [Tribolium castaneum]|eukprot:XP_008190626.1 PREDICTED: A disintegrin and metalloproteinase with thrombospondin motifs 9 isoform X2 [Tribolium castaneum]
MCAKVKHRCTTALIGVCILALGALIATVWIMLGQGAFKHKQEKIATVVKQKEYIEKTHLDDFDSEVEFVKPLKISPLPLHTHDIIFDQMRNNYDKPPLRHHSGHFRHKEAEVWDPHPRYVINAFGRKLFLELEHNDQILATDLHVTHVGDDYTHRRKQDSSIYGCFYTGKIKDDLDSAVSVSLCNGMTGYIRTSHDNYYIEPAEKSSGEYPLGSFLHRIKKIHNSAPTGNEVVVNESDQCETNDNESIVEDDFGSSVVAIPSHTLTKRAIVDDIGDSPFLSRKIRDADWPINYETDQKTNEYFVKVLVVADRSMIQYHQSNEDLKHYILILMSHAALLYKDASIGNSISLSVVNIWLLNNTVFTSNNSQVMLRRFCEWQKRYVTDRKHDMALLFTRDPICKKNSSSCDTLGVAEVGSMCNPSSSCAIVKERGLSSSYTIAHELGHVLSMLHDETESCSHFSRGPKSENIMSRILNNGTKPWLWSECSKHFLTEFLESNKAKCLLNAPTSNYISSEISDLLPGENFEADKQCELEFGIGYKLCSYQASCAVLWCTSNDIYGCKSNLLPWADGTSCGRNRWCHHGQCIPLDRQKLTPIPGGWGPWQPWSDCSRTCGGGVKQTRRYCDSPVPQNGGPYCTGKSIQYVSCNTESCDDDVPDFREVQCSQFDGINKNLANLTKDVKWVPKYGLSKREDLCKLFCRPENSNAYYPLKDKVIDGTKCGLNSFDICVNGICRPGGCDNKLNSKMDLDECGVCGGDNSKCEEITGNYNVSMTGYNIVLRIPKGSSNIDIRQNANNDTNYLVLVDGETGEYVLNSKTMIAPQQKDVIFAGIIISYSGSSAAIERITTPKNHKLTKDLVLGVLSVGHALAPDITYRYIIDRENAPKYGWRLYRNKWSKCNSICSGTQYMSPICIELATNKEQPESFCPQHEKQHHMQKQDCNTHCQLRWSDVSRGPCSVNCGQGVRSVYHQCVKIDMTKENYDRYHEVVDHKHCNILGKPPTMEVCQGRCESTRWEYTSWSECSTSCGGGTQRRSAKCVDNNSRTLDDSYCPGEKITEQRCNTQKCPIWESREWTPCSVTCGRGFRTKPYFCHIDGKILDPSACDSRQKHIEEEQCYERPCAGWSIGPWGECSTTCGDGTSTRQVICQNLDDNQVIQDSFCSGILKPNETKFCKIADCVQSLPYQRRYDYGNDILANTIVSYERGFKWVTGAWSQCSKSCGTGVSSRMVVCRNELGEEDERYCAKSVVPVKTIECNTGKCPAWEFGGWSGCDFNCEKRRQVTCRAASGSFVEDTQCDKHRKPSTTTKCKLSQCPHLASKPYSPHRYRWSVGKWKRCSTTCGEGQKHRTVECKDTKTQTTLVDQFCDNQPKPKTTTKCEKYMCDYAWITSPWTQCSAFCGQGVQRRNVSCHRVYGRGAVDPKPLMFNKAKPNDFCNLYEKPVEEMGCNGGHCKEVYVWRSDPWKECSYSCGKKGRRSRQIYCMNVKTGQKVEKRHCPRHSRPKRRLKCNQWRCLFKSCKEIQTHTKTRDNKDYLITIRNRPAWVYCYKMDTNQPEEYITLHGDTLNYAENYDKRLKNPHSCPYDGQRFDLCDCLPIESDRSGFTTFWKVRLNITSLRIIGDDFTFSRQTKGMKVPYGTAGDCYSATEGCAQARFSIDLKGTSFQLSENVRWHSIGKYATARIDTFEKRVVGLCGGYCGNCVPEPSVGLQVEIT